MGSWSSLIVNAISSFLNGLWRLDTSLHVDVYLVPLELAGFQLLLSDLIIHIIFRNILRLHILL